jgi:hypothetical protein
MLEIHVSDTMTRVYTDEPALAEQLERENPYPFLASAAAIFRLAFTDPKRESVRIIWEDTSPYVRSGRDYGIPKQGDILVSIEGVTADGKTVPMTVLNDDKKEVPLPLNVNLDMWQDYTSPITGEPFSKVIKTWLFLRPDLRDRDIHSKHNLKRDMHL